MSYISREDRLPRLPATEQADAPVLDWFTLAIWLVVLIGVAVLSPLTDGFGVGWNEGSYDQATD